MFYARGLGGKNSCNNGGVEKQQKILRPARRAATEQKIFASVLSIARDRGLHSVTIDEVVADCGVAKTTIYRRYADRREMITAALDSIALQIPIYLPTTRAEFVKYMIDLQRYLDETLGVRLIGSIIASAEPFVSQWRLRLETEILERMVEGIRKGMDEGLYNPNINPYAFVGMLLGGIVMRQAFSEASAERHAENTATVLWPQLAVDPDHRND